MPHPGLVSARVLDEAVASVAPLGRELRRSRAGGWSGRLWVSAPSDSCLIIMADGQILFVAAPSSLRELRSLLIRSGVEMERLSTAGNDDESSLSRTLLRSHRIDPEGLRIALKTVATDTLSRLLGESDIQMQRRPLEPNDRWIERTTRLQRRQYCLSLEETELLSGRLSQSLNFRPQTPRSTVDRLLGLAREFMASPGLYCRLGADWWMAGSGQAGDGSEAPGNQDQYPWTPASFVTPAERQMVEAAAGTGWAVYQTPDGALSIVPCETAEQAAAFLVDSPSQPLVLRGDDVAEDLQALQLRAVTMLRDLHETSGHSIRRIDTHHIEQAVSAWHDAYGRWSTFTGPADGQPRSSSPGRPLEYRLL